MSIAVHATGCIDIVIVDVIIVVVIAKVKISADERRSGLVEACDDTFCIIRSTAVTTSVVVVVVVVVVVKLVTQSQRVKRHSKIRRFVKASFKVATVIANHCIRITFIVIDLHATDFWCKFVQIVCVFARRQRR